MRVDLSWTLHHLLPREVTDDFKPEFAYRQFSGSGDFFF
jgi:hypothetical protein